MSASSWRGSTYIREFAWCQRTRPLASSSMSAAYGMLGRGGMQHPTQDGHAFMLLGANGHVLWHQAYSQMYVDPSQLLADMGPMA